MGFPEIQMVFGSHVSDERYVRERCYNNELFMRAPFFFSLLLFCLHNVPMHIGRYLQHPCKTLVR